MMRIGTHRVAAGRHVAGFTLLEVLVAVAVFVIVGTMAMGGYNELITQSDRVEVNAARIRAVQSAIMRVSQDFATLEPRPVREPLGEELDAALRASKDTEQLVEFTHSSWSNPAGVPRPTLQRVAYRLQDNKLRREYWNVLDRTMTDEPVSVVLLDRVKSITLRFMGSDRDWKEQWPPLGYSGRDAKLVRPLAVEITLELEDWGKITRVIEVAG
jgi:general secretion pathway protein J